MVMVNSTTKYFMKLGFGFRDTDCHPFLDADDRYCDASSICTDTRT